MSTLFKLTATTACILTGAMASAQSADTTGSGQEKSPDQVKCHEIATMDTAVVPGTLYYIAGYRQGSDQSGAGAASGMGTGSTADTGAGTATGATGSSDVTAGSTTGDATGGLSATGSTTGTETGSSDVTAGTTTGDATSGLSATGTSNSDMTSTSGSMDTSGSAQTDTSASGTAGAASNDASSASAGGQAKIARVSGFYEIPVTKVMTVCAETPDRNVSDVVDENRSDAKPKAE